MGNIEQEKRHFERIFFPSGKLISGLFRYEGKSGHGEVTAMIMNISQDGMGITFARGKRPKIEKDSHMLLVKIEEPSLCFMENTEVEVKWILNHESLGYIAAGCQFFNLSPETEKKIHTYIKETKSSMNSQ